MAPRKSKPTTNTSKPARQTRASSKANNTPPMQGLDSQGQAQDPAPAPAPAPAPSKPARQTRASSRANNTPLMQGLDSQGQAQDPPIADPAPAPAPAPQPNEPVASPSSKPATRRPRPVPEGPLRQTRARSKLNNAPPLMKGLDDRGEARDPLSADPAPLPFDDVLEKLGRGRNSASKKANDKRRREHKVAFRAPSRTPSPVPAYVPGSIPVSVPELVAEAPASPDHDWPTVDRPIPPGSQVIWFGNNGQRPARPAVANNEGDAQGTSAGDDPNQDTNATDSDSSDDMEDIPARPKIKIPARFSRNRVVEEEEEEEEEDSDLSDLPEIPETPSHFGSPGSDASGQSPNDGGMNISFDFEEREGSPDSPEPSSPPGSPEPPSRLGSPGSPGSDASGRSPNDDGMIIPFDFEEREGSPDSLSTIEIEIEERIDEEDRPGPSDSDGPDLDGSASQGGARSHDALDEDARDLNTSNGSSPGSIPDSYRRGSAFTPINAHLISCPPAGHSVPPDGTSLFIRSPIAPIAPMGLTTQSPSVNASVVLMESDPDDDGPDDDDPDDDGPDDDGPDDDSSASTSSASPQSEEDDDEMDQTADTTLNISHNCSNGSVKRRRDTDDDDDDDDDDGNAPPAKRQMLESATPSPYKKATQATAPHDSSYSSSKSHNSSGGDDNDDWAKKLGLLQSRRSSSGSLSPLIKPTIDPEMPGLYGSALRPRLHIAWYEQYHCCGYDCPKVHPCKHSPGRPCHQCHSQWHEDWSLYFKCQEILDEAAADPLTSMREAGLETHPDFKKYFEPEAEPCYLQAPQLDHPVGNSIRVHPTRMAKYKLDLMKAKMASEAEEAA